MRIPKRLSKPEFIVPLFMASLITLPAHSQNAYVSNFSDGTVSVVSLATNQETSKIKIFNGFPVGIGISNDGSKVYVASDGGGVVAISGTSSTPVANITLPGYGIPVSIVVSPDATTVYVACSGAPTSPSFRPQRSNKSRTMPDAYLTPSYVVVIPTASNIPLTTIIPLSGPPAGIAITPDGSTLYVAEYDDNVVRVLDTGTNSIKQDISVVGNPHGIAVSPDGKTVYVTNANNDSLSVIPTAQNQVTSVVSLNATGDGQYPQATAVVVAPDNRHVYVVKRDEVDQTFGKLAIVDPTMKTPLRTISVGGSPEAVAVNSDGSKVYTQNEGTNNVSVVDPLCGAVTATATVGTNPDGLGIFLQPATSLPTVKLTIPLPPYMQATLSAPTSLLPYAASCGFNYFDWQQNITILQPSGNVIPNNPSSVPNNVSPSICASLPAVPTGSPLHSKPNNWVADGCVLGAPPNFFDPPQGGYTYQQIPISYDDPFPFYYSQNTVSKSVATHCTVPLKNADGTATGVCDPGFPLIVSADQTKLSFVDAPRSNDFSGESPSPSPLGNFIALNTTLMGVSTTPTPTGSVCALGKTFYCTPLYQWSWTSTFNGSGSGGVAETLLATPIVQGSGTGGVAIATINGVSLPAPVSFGSAATTASGLAFSRVTQSYIGNLSILNSSGNLIGSPLQVLLFDISDGLIVVNASGNLSGVPYLTVPEVAGLIAGQTVKIPLVLKNGIDTYPSFTPQVYSGQFQ